MSHNLTLFFLTVTTPVELKTANRGSLAGGEQIRWQYDVPEEGIAFNLQVEQGRVELYASTQTTSPSEALHEWRIETSSSARVFVKPRTTMKRLLDVKQNTEISSLNETTVPVYMALFGLDTNNTFIVQSGEL